MTVEADGDETKNGVGGHACSSSKDTIGDNVDEGRSGAQVRPENIIHFLRNPAAAYVSGRKIEAKNYLGCCSLKLHFIRNSTQAFLINTEIDVSFSLASTSSWNWSPGNT